VYYQDSKGQYVALSNATYNTCIDRDGDGFIRTSSGYADILAWNNGAGADSNGGVSTADDEAITEYTRVLSTGTRAIAVDKFNDIWVGGYTENFTHLKVNGLLGQPVPNSAFNATTNNGVAGYGGVIDGLGRLWSTGKGAASSGGRDGAGSHCLWLKVPTNFPPQEGIDWQMLTVPDNAAPYGIAVDPLFPQIWQSSFGNVFRWNLNGTPITNANGGAILYPHGSDNSQGLVVGTNGHVWVAHAMNTVDIGHLDTNGVWLGNVDLRLIGIRGEYFDNTNLTDPSVLTNQDASIDFSWTNAWPKTPVPTNAFSVRWTGQFKARKEGDHVFYLSVNAGARARLWVGNASVGNWDDPDPVPLELTVTNFLSTNQLYTEIKLEYKNISATPQIQLSWTEPGTTNRTVIPHNRFYGPDQLQGPTGVSIDSSGKIWAGCYNSDVAVRIDPNDGDQVVVNGVTNHVGAVDMVVDLGNGGVNDPHQGAYKTEAVPYNYSDMTGLNMRVVNPSLQPLKGYWIVANDSAQPGQLWNKVSWTAALTNGCSVEVYVRASDDRSGLGSETFVPATNNVLFPAIRGRYIEVRLSISRDDASKQPVLYDLTLYGTSSSFAGDYFLYDAWAEEGTDGIFSPNLTGPGPMTYQWFRMYPWETNWVQVTGATNSYFVVPNVDSWVDWTMVSVLVSNGNGESLSLGPAFLEMIPAEMRIPAINYPSGQGPATRYPSTLNVFGQPTNLDIVVVSLWDLNHARSADMNLLLVSPSGKNIVLMSNVGGTNGVSHANLRFLQPWSVPPQSAAIPSGITSTYGPSNYGQNTRQTPFQLPAGPLNSLGDLQGDDPNGVWKLYIYDSAQPGGTGQILGSWSLDFTFQ
jgi:hypothetical protein